MSLVNVSDFDVEYRGYRIGVISAAVVERFPEFVLALRSTGAVPALEELLGRMVDLGADDSTPGCMFEAVYGGERLWLSLSTDDVTDIDDWPHRLKNGFWTLYFPREH